MRDAGRARAGGGARGASRLALSTLHQHYTSFTPVGLRCRLFTPALHQSACAVDSPHGRAHGGRWRRRTRGGAAVGGGRREAARSGGGVHPLPAARVGRGAARRRPAPRAPPSRRNWRLAPRASRASAPSPCLHPEAWSRLRRMPTGFADDFESTASCCLHLGRSRAKLSALGSRAGPGWPGCADKRLQGRVWWCPAALTHL